jgi:hypothetical protein
MIRRIRWAMLVAIVVFFGGVLYSQQKIEAQGPSYSPVTEPPQSHDKPAQQGEEPRDPEGQQNMTDAEILVQLKEINAQLKGLNALLRSGNMRVVVAMNANEKPEENTEEKPEEK